MNGDFITLEMNRILALLQENALTDQAKTRLETLSPAKTVADWMTWTKETTEGRRVLDHLGTPPLMEVKKIGDIVEGAVRGEMLSVEDLESLRQYASSCQRLKRYLLRCEDIGSGLAGFGTGMDKLEELEQQIGDSIRGHQVDDGASGELKDIRRKLESLSANIRQKLETILKSRKECFSEHFVSNRNGHFTLPVKKEYKLQISGSVIDVSSTGATYFIEPTSVSKLKGEFQNLQIEESNEVRRILYTLSDLVASFEREIKLNLEYVETLDYIFAKGKLSQQMEAVEAVLGKERRVKILQGRHPLLEKSSCVPLDIEMGESCKGIVITGPNTGGKTVALKTVGLFSLMAQCGLHIPCEYGEFCMFSSVLCDIGDGQSISENLSTFSAHIKKVISILAVTNADSLVLMDELGSGTDPAEGMGLAVAILEELRTYGCMFLVTTHYPEVKDYAARTEGIVNARMAFDKASLKPLYRLLVGEAGESCALYIARELGMPRHMLIRAYEEAYPKEGKGEHHSQLSNLPDVEVLKEAREGELRADKRGESEGWAPKKEKEKKTLPARALGFQIGDSVVVYPEGKLGIVYQMSDNLGRIGVQIQKQKKLVSYKRLKLKASAKDLYPEDYDFSIIFDSVEVRKARNIMDKRHQEGLEIRYPQ